MQLARQASTRVDNELARSRVIPKSILDARTYNRQNLVRAVLHDENIPIDDQAIYVGDRATTTHPGDFLFRRSRSYDPGQSFKGRFSKHRGELLMQGLINPSFGTYYS